MPADVWDRIRPSNMSVNNKQYLGALSQQPGPQCKRSKGQIEMVQAQTVQGEKGRSELVKIGKGHGEVCF